MFDFAQALRAFAQRHVVLIVLIALAIVFYAIGFKKGSMIAFALGFLFELGFWARLFRSDRRK
ncbi:MAG: hypothetical protein EAZ24_07365 [Burkholderiales bacterium]|nr:MAG: hypothetical protein EAZ24_07365 [Burkholderiales bacterium]